MARTEEAIFCNMCMIRDGEKVLVLDRKNPDWPGVTFPGGHVEKEESFVDAIIREVFEETGLTITAPQLCGTKQFQTEEGARYVVFFYKTSQFAGQLSSSSEGEVFWIDRKDLSRHPLAPDMMAMVEVMENEQLSEFYYYKEDGNWKFRLQ